MIDCQVFSIAMRFVVDFGVNDALMRYQCENQSQSEFRNDVREAYAI